jgi:hydrogenase-4 component F
MTFQVLVIIMLLAPVIGASLVLIGPGPRWTERISVTSAVITLLFVVAVIERVASGGPTEAVRGLLHIDALSAAMLGIIAFVSLAAVIASVPYLRHDLAIGHVPGGDRGVRLYFAGLLVFVWTMLLTVTVDNLGLLWVGLEATTLVSALLVGFYRTRAALEAAWKYLMLCTVGITCALFGVLLTYYAARQGAIGHSTSMDWSRLILQADGLDAGIMRLAFVFVLVGFGAKAGFAPLHTWLADAHSQAPSPVSGLLSGVLLACALYGILRFLALTELSTGTSFASHLLLAFGVLSVVVAMPFILVQRDLKRLFAYSSVEHIGLMAVAFGIGGPVGITAGMLHMMSHAAIKSFVFFVSGDLVQRFGTRRISAIRGAARVSPFSGSVLIAGVFALTGAPPFGIFISELTLFGAGFGAGWPELSAVAIVILALAVIFAGLLAHTMRVAYGPSTASDPGTTTEASSRNRWLFVASVVPLVVAALWLGVYVPEGVRDLIADVHLVLEPVQHGGGQ